MKNIFHKKNIILFYFHLIVVPISIFGQASKVRYIGIENGLSNNAVTSIFQDHKGFMWVGTYDGLNRYDGYGFKVFRNILGDSNTISSNGINAIEEDNLNNLWICNQKGVNILDAKTQLFLTPKNVLLNGKTNYSLQDNIICIKYILPGLMLVGTQHNGLFNYKDINHGEQIELSLGNENISGYYVNAIEYNPTIKEVYVFVDDYGLCKYDIKKNKLILLSGDLKNANSLKLDAKGKLWIGTNWGLFYYDESKHSILKNGVREINSVVDLFKAENGDLWIATDGGGIWILEKGREIPVQLNKSSEYKDVVLNSNAIYSIYIDHDNRKWVGTLRGGINIIEPDARLFKKVEFNQDNPGNAVNNFISAFCEDEKGNFLIGTDGGGLYQWNKTTGSFQKYVHLEGQRSSISSNFITSIVKDKKNNIWVSTWFGGINKFDRSKQTFKQYACYNKRTRTENANVWRLFVDGKGKLWACAVRNGGVFVYDEKSDAFQEFDNKLTEIQVITEDNTGEIWGGDYASLIHFDTVHKAHKIYNIGFTVRSLWPDKQGNIWIGTEGSGLMQFNTQSGTHKKFTTNDGLPSNTILNILEDKKSRLWMSTYNGISCFDLKKNSFVNYSRSDGLQSNLFSYNAAYKTTDNLFLFGGIKGFNVFNPDSVSFLQHQPMVLLDGFTVNNLPPQRGQIYITNHKNQTTPESIELPYNKATLTLNYTAIEYSRTQDLKYAYRLKGWDKQWNYVNSVRTAFYSRLNPGDYTFEVMASNTDGMWARPVELLFVKVLPPWHNTWWAYLMYISALAASIYLMLAYQKKQATLRHNIRLAKLETQKERELSEKKIEFFTNISHEFRSPLSLILNPVIELQTMTDDVLIVSKLNMVQRNASRLLRLVNQLLLFEKSEDEMDKLNLEPVNLNNLCEEVYQYFSEQAKVKEIDYQLISNYQGMNLLIDKEKMEIVLFNILSNSLKFTSKGGFVIFSLEEDAENIFIRVEDNGIGIPEDEKKKLFKRFSKFKNTKGKTGFGIGLYLAKKFVEAHQGFIDFKSIEGKGTSFQIALLKQAITPTAKTNIKNTTFPTSNADVNATHPENNRPMYFDESLLMDIIPDEVVSDEIDVNKELITQKPTILFIDDDKELQQYLKSFFSKVYQIYCADEGETGIVMAREIVPDLIITDIVMKAMDGISLCNSIKSDAALAHIPVIVLSGNASNDTQLRAIEKGADDYIKKPFDINILDARIKAILKRGNVLQKYFFNEITLGSEQFKVSPEYKEFIEMCIKIIEEHLQDDQFTIKVFSKKLGMSHSNLYKKIKTVSGLSINAFIRLTRLKKSAEFFINTELNVNETANLVGYYNSKYFRLHFQKLYGLTPSEYIKKYRKKFHNKNRVKKPF